MSLYFNDDNNYLFVNGKEIFNFSTQFCLGSVSNGFRVLEPREVSLNQNMFDLLVDCNSIDESVILNFHKYLMSKNMIKIIRLIKKVFIGLFTGLVNGSNHTKCIA